MTEIGWCRPLVDGYRVTVSQLLLEVTELLKGQLPRDEGSFERLETLRGQVCPLPTSCWFDHQEATFNHPGYRRWRFRLTFVWSGFATARSRRHR